MNRYSLYILVFFLFSFVQEPAQIVGKWGYHQFETQDVIEEEAKSRLDEIFSKLSWHFTEDGNYTFRKSSRKEEKGTWTVDADYIQTETTAGVKEKIKYVLVHRDTLKLEIDKDKYIVFKRVP